MGDGHHHGHAYAVERPAATGSAASTGTALLTPAVAVAVAAPRAVLGLDTGAADLPTADAVLQALDGLPVDTVGCTHLIHGEYPHLAVTVEVSTDEAAAVWELLRAAANAVPGAGAAWGYRRHGAAPAAEAAGAACAVHSLGGGRAVCFPGAARLTGTITVDEVLAHSAIQRVTLLGGGTADGAAEIVTRGHVRPQRRGGELVLPLMPTAGGRLAPLEFPEPVPCCAGRG